MTRFRRAVALLAFGAVAAACTRGAETPAPSALAGVGAASGCYRFTGGPGLGLPWGVQLLSAPLEGWPGLPEARRARSFLTPSELADHPFGFWADAPGDSIRIGYPAGGAITLVLAFDGASLLAGRGTAAGDAIPLGGPPPMVTAAVTAERVACPAD